MTDFNWSYSSLKQFLNCPRNYNEVRILKNYVSQDTPQTIYGKEVHKALEDYVRDNVELAKNYERFKKVVDELIAIPGDKFCEYEMALGKDKTPCDFSDDNRWVRGIVDLLIVDGDYAFIIDYKTGSNRYPDAKQLRLMALMTFAHFPKVNTIKAGLLFLMKNSFLGEEYRRTGVDASWKQFEQPLARLNQSYESNIWTPNPTPLCKFCPVNSCEFNKQ
jgi:CRISPR/Cas system-associated exonuclease Cas4 (RecB family)